MGKEGGQREVRFIERPKDENGVSFNPNEFYSEIIDSSSYDIVGDNPVTESNMNS